MPCELAEFYRRTRDARKVFVVDLGFLGDTIHLTPALWELKRNYPQAELHVATAAIGAELLRMVACVDRTWPLNLGPGGAPWREQWQWIRDVRRQRFDVAFNFSGADRTIFLTALSGARRRVAQDGGCQHFYNPWLIPHWVPRRDRTTHVAEQRRQMLATCGLTLGELRYDLRVPAEAMRWAAGNVPDNAIHLSPNASHSLKEWPLEHWVDLGRRLLREHPAVTLVATSASSERERTRIKALAEVMNSARLAVHPGDLTLPQLAALLTRCRLHVGADSGGLHLAWALGVPTISLFREYEGLGEWLPRGERHRHIVVPCRCVNRKVMPCLEGNRAVCLAGILPEAVYQQVAGLLSATAGGVGPAAETDRRAP